MTIKYETIENARVKETEGIFSFLFGSNSDYFKPEESNRIITDLVEKIKQYEETREIETRYTKVMTNQGERIKKVEIKSKDKSIKGIIEYFPRKLNSLPGCVMGLYTSPCIEAKFHFNSNNPADKQEYLDLVEIIKNM